MGLNRTVPERWIPIGVIAAAALAGLLFGFDTAVISGVIGPLTADFALTSVGVGTVVSSALVGTLAAAMLSGKLGDRHGARTMLRWVAVAFILSGVGCALADDMVQFVLFRFVGGLAIGGASVLAPVFIAEVSPADRRGRLVGLFQLSIVSGILLAYLSNAAVAQLFAGEGAWRWKMAATIVPGAVFLLAILAVPHSPRWLASRGRRQEAEQVAARLRLSDLSLAVADDGEASGSRLNWARHRRPMLLAIALATFNQLTGINAILYYLNDIFAAAGYSDLASDLQAIAIGVANLVSTLVAMALIDRLGRRALLLVGSVGTTVALAGAALVFAGVLPPALLLWLLILFIVFFAISQGAVIWVYLAEIFPTAVRARGQALGSATHWIWAAVLSFGFPVMADRLEPAAPFWLFALACVVQFVVVRRFFPETKGVVLEDMEAVIGGGRRAA